jgi:hypothetical protein
MSHPSYHRLPSENQKLLNMIVRDAPNIRPNNTDFIDIDIRLNTRLLCRIYGWIYGEAGYWI